MVPEYSTTISEGYVDIQEASYLRLNHIKQIILIHNRYDWFMTALK